MDPAATNLALQGPEDSESESTPRDTTYDAYGHREAFQLTGLSQAH